MQTFERKASRIACLSMRQHTLSSGGKSRSMRTSSDLHLPANICTGQAFSRRDPEAGEKGAFLLAAGLA